MTGDKRTADGRSGFRSFLGLWGPPAVLAAVIFTLSSIPGNSFPDHPEALNVVVHFLEFFFLAFALSRAISPMDGEPFWRLMLPVLLICGGLGLMDELYQLSVPLRVSDPMDLLVDLSGAFAGTIAYLGLRTMKKGEGGGVSG